MKNILKKIIVILVMIFFNIVCIRALPSTLGPIKQVGSKVMDNCGGESCYGLALKVSSSTAVICTEYNKPTPAAASATCTMNNDWDEKVRYGVAAIISKASSNISASSITNQYFAAEMAINRFLSNKSAGGASIAGTALSSTYKSLYIDYLDTANAAYDSYATDSNISITLSTSSLTFTKNGDNYESNNVTVSGVSNYSVSTNLGTVSKSGQTFKVVVPASSVSSTKSIEVTVSASKTLNQARNYSCGSNYQTITPVALDTVTKSASKSISGTITPKAKLTINKLDQDNNHLSGATIKVTGPNNYSNTFTTVGRPIVLENLEYGLYTITEIKAPAGYVVASPKTVTLSSSNLTSTVTLTDKKNKIIISKLDVTGKKELPGATLQVQDENGKILHEWISTSTPYVIEGIGIGKYYLIETIAPTGYVLSNEKIEFIVTEKTIEERIEMSNKLNIVKISKLSAVNKKELPGATLEIQDEQGNIVKYCIDEAGNTNTECKWVSTDKPYEIEGLPTGKYYLVETISPKGYELNKEKVLFEVKDGVSVTEVVMENQLEVEVPSTLSSRSALLLTIAMFDIALGIGIVTYVKKNKIKE